jgi:IS30 family transposase
MRWVGKLEKKKSQFTQVLKMASKKKKIDISQSTLYRLPFKEAEADFN